MPNAPERPLEPEHSGEQNVELARLDLLKRADVEIGHLGKPLLRQPFGAALAANVRSEARQFVVFSSGGWHAPLRRNKPVDVNGATGRNLRIDGEG